MAIVIISVDMIISIPAPQEKTNGGFLEDDGLIGSWLVDQINISVIPPKDVIEASNEKIISSVVEARSATLGRDHRQHTSDHLENFSRGNVC